MFARAGYRTFMTGKWHNGQASALRTFMLGKSVFFGGMGDPYELPVADFTDKRTLTDTRKSGKHSVELFAASDASFELARARLELAHVLASLDKKDAAVRGATLALTRLDEIGAVAEAARARKVLRDLGAPPAPRRARQGEQLLTPREVEIIRLVSEGLTDGEIAVRLVLSKHTVHRHLQNAYARLGCSSRASAVAKANRLNLL